MKTIIAGSRGVVDYNVLLKAVGECGWEITHVISGAARGADALGERYAKENNLPLTRMPADWNKGRGAGYIRNIEMASIAEACLVLWDGESKGSAHMINIAAKNNLKLFVKTTE